MVTERFLGRLALCLLLVCAGACASMDRQGLTDPGVATEDPAEEPLSTWRDTAEKQAILDYVAEVTRAESPDFIPPERRVAAFDFDGTIGCEKPDYMEVLVAAARLCEQTVDQPALLQDPLYRAACEEDLKTLDAQVEEALLKAFEGTSQSFYVEYVQRFLRTASHPRFDRPYAELYYLPMRELIEFLHGRGFAVYIVSGSQQGFTRTFASSVLGIAPERSIGHAVELDFSTDGGSPELLRQDAFLDPSVGGKGKAEVIRQRIGRPPVLAFGNSMGDFEMLQYATGGADRGLGLILVHDDPEEYVYADSELQEHAEQLGWQIVSMKDNFEVVFQD